MNPRLARLLTSLYPRSWRARYGAEFEAHLETGHSDLRTSADVAWAALRERLDPTQEIREPNSHSTWFHSCCERAPWAIFSLAPVFLLGAAYSLACLILWSGWKVFIPAADTPFGGGGAHGFANLYFQIGRYFYWSAPVLVGWAMELIAARQKVKAAWPAIGLLLVACMGATARIRASRAAVPSGLGHIRMDFALRSAVLHDGMLHAGTILSLTILPYLLWRIQKSRSSHDLNSHTMTP